MSELVDKIAAVLYGGNLQDCYHPEMFRRQARKCLAVMVDGPFICGDAGTKDAMGLPAHLLVCPTHGLAGFAMYTKTKDYSEPGY